MKRILVIGGYGNFGFFISQALAKEPDIQVLVAGRNLQKAERCCRQLPAVNPPLPLQLDIREPLDSFLAKHQPQVVIHTSGPFQGQGYQVAEACIRASCHYVDLADGRDFVCGIDRLNQQATAAKVLVCSGASSVPGLSSALIKHYQSEFMSLESIDYGISTAHKTSRGLATTQAVLSYAGKPITTLLNGHTTNVIGWRDTRALSLWGLGKGSGKQMDKTLSGRRLLGNCDIPDLQLFPTYFPSLKSIRFQAGLELPFIHHTLAILACLVQHKLLPNLKLFARPMLTVSSWFDGFGSTDSAFFMLMKGLGEQGQQKTIRFDLVARQGDGLNIPTIPAILVALKLCRDKISTRGAHPCIGLVSLEEYLDRMRPLNIQWQTQVSS